MIAWERDVPGLYHSADGRFSICRYGKEWCGTDEQEPSKPLRGRTLREAKIKAELQLTGSHKHKCGGCGHVWEHSNDYTHRPEDSHFCSKCGAEQCFRYWGDEPAAEVQHVHPSHQLAGG